MVVTAFQKTLNNLLRNFDQVPQKIMEAIIDSNTMRKDFLGLEIAKLKPKKVGVYRLGDERRFR